MFVTYVKKRERDVSLRRVTGRTMKSIDKDY